MSNIHIKVHQEEPADQIELRSEEVQEIMGQLPAWIIRWGITVIFLVVLAALGLAYFVKYPDILTAQVVITSDPPPIRLQAQMSSKLDYIFVEEGEQVSQGQWLVVLDAAADWRDVQQLEQKLKQAADLRQLLPLADYNLGSLQPSYSAFRKALKAWHFFRKSKNHRSWTHMHTSLQANELSSLNQNISEQLKLKERELLLAEKEYKINQELYEQGSISRVELEQSEVEKIQKKLTIKQLEAQINSNEIQRIAYKQQLNTLGQEGLQDAHQFQIDTKETKRQLLSAIEIWKKQYVLIAPQAGQVAFADLWTDNQQVEQGRVVLSLLAPSSRIIGKATLSQQGAGKLRIGQNAQIKLEKYDYRQFGTLPARVKHISPIPQKDQYLVELELTTGFTTSYNQELSFQAECYGQADIFTDELRLLERLFYELRGAYR